MHGGADDADGTLEEHPTSEQSFNSSWSMNFKGLSCTTSKAEYTAFSGCDSALFTVALYKHKL